MRPGDVALAAECGPTVVTDGYFPEDYRVTLTQEIKSKHFDIVYKFENDTPRGGHVSRDSEVFKCRNYIADVDGHPTFEEPDLADKIEAMLRFMRVKGLIMVAVAAGIQAVWVVAFSTILPELVMTATKPK